MDANSIRELYEIKEELKSIIKELEDIESGVRNDFKNIGNDICADRIRGVADQYGTVLKKLENIDTQTVTEEFANAHS